MTSVVQNTQSALAADDSNMPCLIGLGDAPPFTLYNGKARAPMLVVCDHASNATPQGMENLGMSASCFQDHIAYDLGTTEVGIMLADRMGCSLILAGYSRLLIDNNRPPGHPQSIPPKSDDILIPSNLHLSEADMERRTRDFFWPYHNAISDTIAHLWRTSGTPPALVSMHSFTPQMRSREQARPWHIGVMYNRDRRLAGAMIETLSEHTDLIIGDNEPYSGQDVGFTADTHGGAAGLPHVTFEIRQDLLADEAGRERWTDLLYESLSRVLSDKTLLTEEHF